MSFSRIDVTEGVGLSTKDEHLRVVKTVTPVFVYWRCRVNPPHHSDNDVQPHESNEDAPRKIRAVGFQNGRAGEVGLDEGRSSRIICGTLMFALNAGNLWCSDANFAQRQRRNKNG